MQKKRLVSVLLVGALTFGSAVQVKADDLQDAQNQASELQDKKAAAQAEKDNLAAQLEKIVDDMDKTLRKNRKRSLQRQMNSSLLRLMRITSITA